MVRTPAALVLALVALAVWAPTASACRGGAHSPSPQTIDEARAVVICLINRRRHHHHLRRLPGDPALGTSAQRHSDAMITGNFFAHNGPDGTPRSRAADAGYPQGARSWQIGEDLGFGTGRLGTPKSLVAAWMASGTHRAVILSRRWRQIGVGVSIGSPLGPDGGGMATYTVDFGFRKG
jgi:uncharacterized protein YkwD